MYKLRLVIRAWGEFEFRVFGKEQIASLNEKLTHNIEQQLNLTYGVGAMKIVQFVPYYRRWSAGGTQFNVYADMVTVGPAARGMARKVIISGGTNE